MKVSVTLAAYGNGEERIVTIPDNQLWPNVDNNLELVFEYGQNEVQPQNKCSVSVGDIIHWVDADYMVSALGFTKC